MDKRIDDFCQGTAQKAILRQIREQFLGELPVGMAFVLSMPITRLPFVIAAPTMRIPSDVAGTLNAYLALRAVLVAVLHHNAQTERPIGSIAVPGLCTGVGRMPCSVAAQQMRAAYDNILCGGWKDVLHPVMAPFAFGDKKMHWRETR